MPKKIPIFLFFYHRLKICLTTVWYSTSCLLYSPGTILYQLLKAICCNYKLGKRAFFHKLGYCSLKVPYMYVRLDVTHLTLQTMCILEQAGTCEGLTLITLYLSSCMKEMTKCILYETKMDGWQTSHQPSSAWREILLSSTFQNMSMVLIDVFFGLLCACMREREREREPVTSSSALAYQM